MSLVVSWASIRQVRHTQEEHAIASDESGALIPLKADPIEARDTTK